MRVRTLSFLARCDGWLWKAVGANVRAAVASDLVRKVSEAFAARILLIGLGLVTSVLVARLLGPEGRGLYAVAMTVSAIGVQFGNLGLHASNTYYVARDRELLPVLISNTLAVSFVAGGAGVGLAWGIFALWPELAPVHGQLLALAFVWIPFGLAYLLVQNLLLGVQEVRAYNKIELATRFLAAGLIGLVFILHIVNVEAVFFTGLVALILGLAWGLWRLRSYFSHLPAPSLTLFKANLRYGLKAYTAALFAFLVLKFDLLMVKYMLGGEQAGYYSVVVSIADMIYLLPVTVGTILFPTLSALADVQAKWRLTERASLVMGVLLLPPLALSVMRAEAIVRLLFGDTFVPAVPALIWLAPGILFLGIQTVAVQFLNSIGFPRRVVAIWGFSWLVNIGLNLWSIPRYGISGASAVSTFSYLIVLILVIGVIRRSLPNVTEGVARVGTSYLDEIAWDMHGHRKKALFFIACLHDYAACHGLQPAEVRVLELGCGHGRIVALPVAEQGFDVTGVDIYEPSIASAKAYNRLPNARFVCSDFREFNSAELYHVVILSDVLEHVSDPHRMLEVALAHLTSQGMILISIPNGYGPFEIEGFLARVGLLKLALAMVDLVRAFRSAMRLRRRPACQTFCEPDEPAYNYESGHVQFFTLASFNRLLASAGLRVEQQINGCWFGGPLSCYLFRAWSWLSPFTLRVADALPPALVSSWYFRCSRGPSDGTVTESH